MPVSVCDAFDGSVTTFFFPSAGYLIFRIIYACAFNAGITSVRHHWHVHFTCRWRAKLLRPVPSVVCTRLCCRLRLAPLHHGRRLDAVQVEMFIPDQSEQILMQPNVCVFFVIVLHLPQSQNFANSLVVRNFTRFLISLRTCEFVSVRPVGISQFWSFFLRKYRGMRRQSTSVDCFHLLFVFFSSRLDLKSMPGRMPASSSYRNLCNVYL